MLWEPEKSQNFQKYSQEAQLETGAGCCGVRGRYLPGVVCVVSVGCSCARSLLRPWLAGCAGPNEGPDASFAASDR